MNTTYNYRNLGCAIVLQAVKDYCEPKCSNAMKGAIMKNLKSDYLIQLSDGLSLVAATELQKNPKEIAIRLGKLEEEDLQ
jgi:uncharacterized protein YeeX (DUF496 family)